MRLHIVPLSDAHVGNCSTPRFLIVLDEIDGTSPKGMESCRETLDGCVGTLAFADRIEVTSLMAARHGTAEQDVAGDELAADVTRIAAAMSSVAARSSVTASPFDML